MKTGLIMHQKPSPRREVDELLRSIKNLVVGLYYFLEAIIGYLLLNIKRKKNQSEVFFRTSLCVL